MKKYLMNDICEYDSVKIICSEALLAECRQYIKNKLTRNTSEIYIGRQ